MDAEGNKEQLTQFWKLYALFFIVFLSADVQPTDTYTITKIPC